MHSCVPATSECLREHTHTHTHTLSPMLHLAYLSLWYTCRHLYSDRHLTFTSSTSFLTWSPVQAFCPSSSLLCPITPCSVPMISHVFPFTHSLFSYAQLDDCLLSERVELISLPSHPGSLGACCGLQLVFFLPPFPSIILVSQTSSQADAEESPADSIFRLSCDASDRQPGSNCFLCVS